jgi:hypothetical protein
MIDLGAEATRKNHERWSPAPTSTASWSWLAPRSGVCSELIGECCLPRSPPCTDCPG